MIKNNDFDYVINGGGMVGAAAALALAQQQRSVLMVDAQGLSDEQSHWDLRISSINDNHWQWLLDLGVERTINWRKVRPYQGLSVTTLLGTELSFSAQEVDRSQLGVMVENNNLQRALWRCLEASDNVTIISNQRIEQLELSARTVCIAGVDYSYHYLIGADGAASYVAKQAGIGYRGWDYGQRCILAVAQIETPVADATWEVFRPQGPFALLPLTENRVCLIDYRSSQEVTRLSADKGQLHRALAQQFEPYVGALTIEQSGSFPLQRKRALTYCAQSGSVLLMGDAAHSIHPLAGQGVNLGFADIRQWLDSDGNLAAYEQQRMRANQQMMRAMDMINVGFRTPNPMVQGVIAAGMKIIEVTPLKQQMLKQALQL